MRKILTKHEFFLNVYNRLVDEMADFFYQNMMGMADTYLRATRQEELANDMKDFARSFYKKFRATQLEENK